MVTCDYVGVCSQVISLFCLYDKCWLQQPLKLYPVVVVKGQRDDAKENHGFDRDHNQRFVIMLVDFGTQKPRSSFNWGL